MPTHTNTQQMLEDLRSFGAAHPGALIESFDNPNQMLVGFLVRVPNGEERVFNVSLSRMKETPPADPHFNRLIRTAEGRRYLAEMFQVPVPFDLAAHLQQPMSWDHLLEDDGL